MRKYKCIIQLHHHPHRTRAIRYISKKTAKKYGNVSNFIFEEFPKRFVKRIYVRLYNDNTKKHYLLITYDYYLESLKKSRDRIELTYRWGEKERCLIGKSTGWTPRYLALKRVDSISGAGLLAKCVSNIRLV